MLIRRHSKCANVPMSSINLFNQGQDDKPLVTTTEVIKRQSDVQSACQLREK